jgi:metal-responsive CopG/Arc/MetJ family transcriptional regulator
VKTAISVPDEIFKRATHHAERLGMSRSEFFSTAARRWADQLEEGELTEAIDAAVASAGSDDDLPFVRRAAARLLEADEARGQ